MERIHVHAFVSNGSIERKDYSNSIPITTVTYPKSFLSIDLLGTLDPIYESLYKEVQNAGYIPSEIITFSEIQ